MYYLLINLISGGVPTAANGSMGDGAWMEVIQSSSSPLPHRTACAHMQSSAHTSHCTQRSLLRQSICAASPSVRASTRTSISTAERATVSHSARTPPSPLLAHVEPSRPPTALGSRARRLGQPTWPLPKRSCRLLCSHQAAALVEGRSTRWQQRELVVEPYPSAIATTLMSTAKRSFGSALSSREDAHGDLALAASTSSPPHDTPHPEAGHSALCEEFLGNLRFLLLL